MSVYAITTDQRIIRYDSPAGKSTWLQTDTPHHRYYIFYKNCDCKSCSSESHRTLIAYVPFSSVLTIGFEKPVVVEGRLLTYSEKTNLRNIKDWLDKRAVKGNLPRKLNTAVLQMVTK